MSTARMCAGAEVIPILPTFLLMLHPAFKNERSAENEVMERGEPI